MAGAFESLETIILFARFRSSYYGWPSWPSFFQLASSHGFFGPPELTSEPRTLTEASSFVKPSNPIKTAKIPSCQCNTQEFVQRDLTDYSRRGMVSRHQFFEEVTEMSADACRTTFYKTKHPAFPGVLFLTLSLRTLRRLLVCCSCRGSQTSLLS